MSYCNKILLHKMLLFVFLIATAANAQISVAKINQAADFGFEIYKIIHQEPELGKKEFKTMALIKSKLKEIGYTEFKDVPGLPTAVIAVLDSKKPGKVRGLRAELDARPGKENTGLSYSSKVDSVMHSCGHDAHASILLATAKLLMENKTALSGKIVFIFQPAEETEGGADDIVKAGIIQQLNISTLFALHVTDGLPTGIVRIAPGFIMAGSNNFTIELEGKSSHAARPFEGSDIPLAVSELVTTLSLIPARRLAISNRPCVISTTYIETGKSSTLNVLPAIAIMKGTIRAYENIDSSYDGQPSIRSIINSSVENFCNPKGISYHLKIEKGSPPTNNEIKLFEHIIPMLQLKFTGKIDNTPFKTMTAEDFSYYTNQIPCLYFGLGVAKGDLGFGNIHSPEFSVHPESFKWGIELMTLLATL